MALTGRTEYRNTNFTGTISKTLNQPGLMAKAWIKLANDWFALMKEHADDNPTFNTPGNFTVNCAVKGYKQPENKRYISSVDGSDRNPYNMLTSYCTQYQYAPGNTAPSLNQTQSIPMGFMVNQTMTNAPGGDITYNLTTAKLSDLLANTIISMQAFAIPQTLSYDSTKKAPYFNIANINKSTMIDLYGDYVVVTGIDIVDKASGVIVASTKYGGTSTVFKPFYDSMSVVRAYGWCGTCHNVKYKTFIDYSTAKDFPQMPALPYDNTTYISEGLSPFVEFTNNFNGGFGFASAFNFGLTDYGYGVLCATTEDILYTLTSGRARTNNTTGNFIMWKDTNSIIKYFVDNVGFGVTINDLDSALDPDTPNPGAQPDDGQPDNPVDDEPGDGDNVSDPIEYPDPSIIPVAGRKFYALTANQVTELTNFLFGETFLSNVKRLWTEPGEYVIDLSYYPVDLTLTGIDFSAADNISVGGVGSNISAPEILGGKPFIYMGDFTPTAYYNSYLDYAPYTRMEIYLPYIGMRPLDVNQVMGHSVHVGYYIDYATQQVMAAIGLDGTPENPLGTPINQYTGNLATHVPLSGQSAQQLLIGTIKQGIGVAGGAASIASGVASANPGQVVGGVTSSIGSLIPEQVNRREYGNITAMTGLYSPQQVFLLIDRPIAAEPSGFKDKLGYSASYGGKVSEFSGYLQCSQADITAGGTMTQAECESIINMLRSGIYV